MVRARAGRADVCQRIGNDLMGPAIALHSVLCPVIRLQTGHQDRAIAGSDSKNVVDPDHRRVFIRLDDPADDVLDGPSVWPAQHPLGARSRVA